MDHENRKESRPDPVLPAGNEMSPLLGFPILAVALIVGWFCIATLLRYTSCWNRIERLYLSRNPRLIKNLGLQRICIASPIDPGGFLNRFGWTLRLGITSSGVYVSAIFPLDRVIRPVVIPWEELSIVEQQYIGSDRYELIPSKLPEIQIILPRKTAEELISIRGQEKPRGSPGPGPSF